MFRSVVETTAKQKIVLYDSPSQIQLMQMTVPQIQAAIDVGVA